MEAILWTVFELVINLFQGFVYSNCAFGMLKCKKSDKARKLAILSLSFILFALITIFNYVTVFEGMAIFLYALIIFLFTCFFCEGGLVQKISISVLSINAAAVGNVLSVNLISYFTKTEIVDLLSNSTTYRLLTVIFANAIFLGIAWMFVHISKENKIALDKREWLFIGTTLALSIITFHYVYNIAFESTSMKSRLYMAFCAIGFTAINTTTYILIVSLSKKYSIDLQNTVLIQQLHFQEERAEVITQQYTELRKAKHDFDNALGVISSLNENGQKDKIAEYIMKYKESLFHLLPAINTDNEYVNAVVNSKLVLAKKKNIYITLNISQDIGEVEPLDICTLIGNMFDNAIEACEKCESERRIVFEIKSSVNLIEILIKNSIYESVLDANPELVTSKTDKESHGFGTKVIREIAERNHGFADFYEEDNMFCCLVSIAK